MKQRINFNKNILLHVVCSCDDLRPAFNYIQFKDGFMIATDAHILVKNKISECSCFPENEIKILDGKYIHSEDYKLLLKYDIVSIVEEGFMVNRGERSFLIKFSKVDRFPNIEPILVQKKSDSINNIGIDPRMIEMLKKALPFKETFDLQFQNKSTAIFVKNPDFESMAILMPKLISE